MSDIFERLDFLRRCPDCGEVLRDLSVITHEAAYIIKELRFQVETLEQLADSLLEAQ